MSLLKIIGSFCQLVLFLLFAYSSWQKLRDQRAFERSVEGFALLPLTWVTPFAWLAISLEIAVVVLGLASLIWGSWLALVQIGLATFLLIIFSGAVTVVLARGKRVVCGCFGADEHPVSALTLVRNVGLLVLGVVGLFSVDAGAVTFLQSSLLALALMVESAAAFVLIWTRLEMLLARPDGEPGAERSL